MVWLRLLRSDNLNVGNCSHAKGAIRAHCNEKADFVDVQFCKKRTVKERKSQSWRDGVFQVSR